MSEEPEYKFLTDSAATAIFNAEPYEDAQLVVYVTRGLSMMIASPARWNDDDEDHDLIMINRFGQACAVTALVMPEFVAEVQAVVDAAKNLTKLMEVLDNDPVRREQPEPDGESARRMAVAKKDREAYGLQDRDAPRPPRPA